MIDMSIITSFIATIATMLICIIVGRNNFFATNKTKFRFKSRFPFEMQNDYKMPYLTYLRIVLALFAVSVTLFSLTSITGKSEVISLLIIFFSIVNALAIVALFMFDFKSYKVHIIAGVSQFSTIILMFGLYGIYVFWGINAEIKVVFAYIFLSLAGLLIISLMNPKLFNFLHLEVAYENENKLIKRPRLNMMALYEWLAIVALGVFQLLVILSLVIK